MKKAERIEEAELYLKGMSDVLGIDFRMVQSRRRNEFWAIKRHVIQYELSKIGFPIGVIAVVTHRTHGAVIYAMRNVEQMKTYDREVKSLVNYLGITKFKEWRKYGIRDLEHSPRTCNQVQ